MTAPIAKLIGVHPSEITKIKLPDPLILIELVSQCVAEDPTFIGGGMSSLRLLQSKVDPNNTVYDYYIHKNPHIENIKTQVCKQEYNLYDPPQAVMIQDLACSKCNRVTPHSCWSAQMRGGDEPESRFTLCRHCNLQRRYG